MVTSAEILAGTGLKSGKTLTRWHQQGVIPAPIIGTHPSGRGKISYWPDWVLERCQRIVALQKEGYTPTAAANQIDDEGKYRYRDIASNILKDISGSMKQSADVVGALVEDGMSQDDAFRAASKWLIRSINEACSRGVDDLAAADERESALLRQDLSHAGDLIASYRQQNAEMLDVAKRAKSGAHASMKERWDEIIRDLEQPE